MESRRSVASSLGWTELESIEDGLDFGSTPIPDHVRAALTDEHVVDILLSLQGASLMMTEDAEDEAFPSLFTAAIRADPPVPPAHRLDMPAPVRPVPSPLARPPAPPPQAAPKGWLTVTLAVLALSIPFGAMAFAGAAVLVFLFLFL